MNTLEHKNEPLNADQYQEDDTKAKIAKYSIFSVVFLALTIFFLIIKFPEYRLKDWISSSARTVLHPQGILFNADRVSLSMIFGPRIVLENVELKSANSSSQKLVFEKVVVRPHLSSLIFGNVGFSISAHLADKTISGAFQLKGSSTSLDVDLDEIELNQLSLLQHFLPVEIKGRISGVAHLTLNAVTPTDSNGEINFSIKKIAIPDQNAWGIQLPRLLINESKIQIQVTQGQISLKDVFLGKDKKTDDLTLSVSGSGKVGKSLESSTMNGKIILDISDKLKGGFPILDALLSSGKTADGKYAFRFFGTLASLDAAPGQ
jgi:type II secretion system protein N